MTQKFQGFKCQGEKIARAGRQEGIIRNNRKYGANSKQKDSERLSKGDGRHNNWKGLKLDGIKCSEINIFFAVADKALTSLSCFLPS